MPRLLDITGFADVFREISLPPAETGRVFRQPRVLRIGVAQRPPGHFGRDIAGRSELVFAVARRGGTALSQILPHPAAENRRLRFPRAIRRTDKNLHTVLPHRVEHFRQRLHRLLPQPVIHVLVPLPVFLRNRHQIIRLVIQRNSPPAIHDFLTERKIPVPLDQLPVARMHPAETEP